MSEIDWRDDIRLVWDGPLPDNLDFISEMVRRDIESSLNSLRVPGDLISHIVFLGTGPDYMDDAGVYVSGAEGDDRFHCEYQEKLLWESLGIDQDDG